MKKVLIVLLVLLMIAGCTGTVYFYMQVNVIIDEKEVLVQQNGELQGAIDAIGPVSYAYTVKADMFAGKEIKADDLIQQTIPVSSINDNYILDTSKLIGMYYKVDIKPGTSLTKDIVMEDEMADTTYERDLSFSFLPLGLKVGDYVDIRMVLPYGEEFVVIQHERVEQVVLSTNTVKLNFDEAQLALWTSALTDQAMWNSKGLSLYITKYIEPGIHEPAVPYYPVRKEMESVVTLNPNIINKKECINASLRDEIELRLQAVIEADGSTINSGKIKEASDINTAKELYINGNSQNKNNGTKPPSAGGVNNSDPTIQDELDILDEIGDQLILDPVDPKGNASSVTQEEADHAEGEDVFSDENDIE